MQQSYTIYYDGEIADNFNPEEVKKRALIVFKLSEENIAILFNGTQHILKENLSETECSQYLRQLLDIGLIAKSRPPLISQSITHHDRVKYSAHNIKRPLKTIFIILFTLLIIGGLYLWQSGIL